MKQLKDISEHHFCIIQYDPKHQRMREVYTHPSMRLSSLSSHVLPEVAGVPAETGPASSASLLPSQFDF